MRRRETRAGYWIRFPDLFTRVVWLAASGGCAWLVSSWILSVSDPQAVVSSPWVALSHDLLLDDQPLADLFPKGNGVKDECLFPHRGEDTRHEQPGSRDYPAQEPWIWHPVPRWECSAGKTRRTGSFPLFRVAFFYRKPISFLQLVEWSTNKTVENQARHAPFQGRCLPACSPCLLGGFLPRSALECPHLA